MSLAVVEEIALEIQSRLVEMIDAVEYTSSIVQVIRPTRLGDFSAVSGTVLLTQSNPSRVPQLDYQGIPPALAYRQLFNLRYLLLTDENSAEPIDTTMNQAHADLVRGIVQADTNWHRFNNFAIDAEFQPLEYTASDGGPDGFNLPLLVTYRISEYDPTESRQ
jgi:hypothetical protein